MSVAPVEPTASETVCRAIRSKGAGVIYGSRVQFENGFYSSAVFWCLATAEPVGPDDGIVHPHACTAERACFRG
jgi:hypothetical protein